MDVISVGGGGVVARVGDVVVVVVEMRAWGLEEYCVGALGYR